MKLMGYIRVSDESQEKNTSLDSQIEDIEIYCKLYNHELLGIIQDVKSGAKIEKRNLKNLVDKIINSNEIEGLIIHKTDRFARNFLEGVITVKALQENKKGLISVKDNFDISTPQGRLTFNMLLSFAEYERGSINERTRRGKEAVKKQGGYAGGGIKLGKKTETRQINQREIRVLVDNEKELEIIKLIKNHKRSGKSLYAIAKYLNENGYKTKRNKEFTVNQIKAVLNEK